MKLAEYIKWKGLKEVEVVKALNITRQHLWSITHEVAPGRKLAIKIINWTDGQVRYDDMWDAQSDK